MRSKIALLGKSKALLAVLVTAVVLALAGTAYGYTLLNKTVTLSLDGQAKQVSVVGSTVGDVLESEDIKVSDHDVVAPGVDEEVKDGSRIAVRFGRPLELTVDGKTQTHWVTSTDVASALGEIGKRFDGADLSASRGADIDRGGMTLEVVTPKTLKIKVGAGKTIKQKVAALTVEDVLKELDVSFDKDDEVKPALDTEIANGDRVVVTKIRIVKKRVAREAVEFETVEKTDDSMFEDESETKTDGVDGLRDVTYRLIYRNGKLVAQKVVTQKVIKKAVDEIVTVGTKEREETAPADFAGGNSVWDKLAACESGGNWAINTGNGYYGGLQFNLGTWQSYGGKGLPSNNSREQQIAVAERLRAANGGGYGSWPHCSQQLGLPQ